MQFRPKHATGQIKQFTQSQSLFWDTASRLRCTTILDLRVNEENKWFPTMRTSHCPLDLWHWAINFWVVCWWPAVSPLLHKHWSLLHRKSSALVPSLHWYEVQASVSAVDTFVLTKSWAVFDRRFIISNTGIHLLHTTITSVTLLLVIRILVINDHLAEELCFPGCRTGIILKVTRSSRIAHGLIPSPILSFRILCLFLSLQHLAWDRDLFTEMAAAPLLIWPEIGTAGLERDRFLAPYRKKDSFPVIMFMFEGKRYRQQAMLANMKMCNKLCWPIWR